MQDVNASHGSNLESSIMQAGAMPGSVPDRIAIEQ